MKGLMLLNCLFLFLAFPVVSFGLSKLAVAALFEVAAGLPAVDLHKVGIAAVQGVPRSRGARVPVTEEM